MFVQTSAWNRLDQLRMQDDDNDDYSMFLKGSDGHTGQ